MARTDLRYRNDLLSEANFERNKKFFVFYWAWHCMQQVNMFAPVTNDPIERDAPPVDPARPNPELDKAMCGFAKAHLKEEDFKTYTAR